MKSNPKAVKKLCIEYRTSRNTNAESLILALKKGRNVSRQSLTDNIRVWMMLDRFIGYNLVSEDADEMADNLIASFASDKRSKLA